MHWQRHPALIRAGLVAGSLLIGMVLLEISFRVAGVKPEFHAPAVNFLVGSGPRPVQQEPFGFYARVNARTEYDSNPRGYFDSNNGVDHLHNSVGWRDVEHSLEKPPGTFRVLGLGDSYLWGQGVKLEDICLNRLGRELNQHLAPTRVETINSGMFALNTVQELESLRTKGLRYDPDLVILHFVPNDVEADIQSPGVIVDFFTDYTATYQRPDWLSGRSHAWGWARQRFLRAVKGGAYVRQSVRRFGEENAQWEACRQALIDIRDLCREHRTGLLVVIFPFFHELDGDYPFQPIHDAVRSHCEQAGIPVLDLRETYRRFNGPELWVHPVDQHPNEIAHELAARATFEYLCAHPVLLQTKSSGAAGPLP